MIDETASAATLDGLAPPAAPGPIVQSATIAFRAVYLVTLLLCLLWLCSNFRVISSDDQAVVMRFGRIVRTQHAGLLIAWPRPIDEVRLLPGPDRQLSRPVGALPEVPGIEPAAADATADATPRNASPYLTGDGRVVLLDATLIYRITDPAAYVLSQDHVAAAVDRMFRATAVQVAAGENLNAFLVSQQLAGGRNGQSVEAQRATVRNDLLRRINARLHAIEASGHGLGMEVDRIDLTAWLPPRAKLAFDSVLTAGQRAEQTVATASTAAELRRAGAQREADRRVRAAQAFALERATRANIDTASIEAVEQLPVGARAGLEQQNYRNAIGSVLGKAGAVVVVDPRSGRQVIMPGSAKSMAASR